MFYYLCQALLNFLFPLKIKAAKGTISGCNLLKLRYKFRGGGLIQVSKGNQLRFKDELIQGPVIKSKVKILIGGENNTLTISLQTERLHPCIEMGGMNNKIAIGKNFKPFSSGMCWYWFGNGNVLTIGDNVTVPNNPRIPAHFNRISMGGENCSITISDNCFLGLNIISGVHNACKDWHFECGEGTSLGGLLITPVSPCKISIGKKVQLSWNVYIGCGSHALIDENGNCRNVCQGVTIGDNCWIGTNVVIPGTTLIPNGCIVGSNAVVTKSFEEERCVLGGVPAKIIKHDVKWIWESPIMVLRGMMYP